MFSAFLSTPGGSLVGRDKDTFDDLKVAADRSTDEMLIRPDWDANLTCVELVNNVSSAVILQEFMVLMRKKLGLKQPSNVVFLSLTLLEALVKNCGIRLHAAVNDGEFMNHMVKVARKFNAPGGCESREVADLVLLILQSWGEAFLPKRNFPNIVKAYQDCRKEGMRFPEQYDENRAPVFTPSFAAEELPTQHYSSAINNRDTLAEDDQNAVLAAAIQASMQSNSLPVRRGSSANRDHRRPSTTPSVLSPSSSQSFIHSLSSLISLLYELISASASAQELGHNELASDMVAQLQEAQSQLSVEIENTLASAPEQVESSMFKWNDEATQAIQFYNNVKSTAIPLATAVEQIQAYTRSKQQQIDNIKKAKSAACSANLLDMDEDYPSMPNPNPANQSHRSPVPATVTSDLGIFLSSTTVAPIRIPSDPFAVTPAANPFAVTPVVTPAADPFAVTPAIDPFAVTPDPFTSNSNVDMLLVPPSNSDPLMQIASRIGSTPATPVPAQTPPAGPFQYSVQQVGQLQRGQVVQSQQIRSNGNTMQPNRNATKPANVIPEGNPFDLF